MHRFATRITPSCVCPFTLKRMSSTRRKVGGKGGR